MLPKLNEFPEIYDVQILTVISYIIDRWMSDGSEKRPLTKSFCLYLLKRRRSYQLIYVKDLFKVV